MERRVELRYDLGSGPAIVISQPVSLDTWYDVVAYRLHREGRLTVNGSSVQGVSPGTTTILNVGGEDYFVGGVEEYSIVSPHAGTEVGLTGCIDNLEVRKFVTMHCIPQFNTTLFSSDQWSASGSGCLSSSRSRDHSVLC